MAVQVFWMAGSPMKFAEMPTSEECWGWDTRHPLATSLCEHTSLRIATVDLFWSVKKTNNHATKHTGSSIFNTPFCTFFWSDCYTIFTVLAETQKLYLPAILHWSVKTYFWDDHSRKFHNVLYLQYCKFSKFSALSIVIFSDYMPLSSIILLVLPWWGIFEKYFIKLAKRIASYIILSILQLQKQTTNLDNNFTYRISVILQLGVYIWICNRLD